MSGDPYSPRVRELFARLEHAGELDEAVQVQVEEQGVRLRLEARLTGREIDALRFRAWGCPHLLAAAEAFCVDYEGRPAMTLLEKIKSDEPLERSQALALINALNYGQALQLPEDPNNRILYKTFGLQAGCKVAMVGYFGPLVTYLRKQKAALEIIDLGRGLTKRERTILFNSARLCEVTKLLGGEKKFEYELVPQAG